MSDKKITLPLSRVLEWLWGYKDRAPVDEADALLIAAIDKDEAICHIQYESLEDGSILDNPLIWRVKEWRTYHLKMMLDKEKQAKQRKEWNLQSENTEMLMRALARKYGIEDREILRGIAHKLARSKNQEYVNKLDVPAKLDMGD